MIVVDKDRDEDRDKVQGTTTIGMAIRLREDREIAAEAARLFDLLACAARQGSCFAKATQGKRRSPPLQGSERSMAGRLAVV